MTKSAPTVVILLSDKRSGSTICQQELCKHVDVQTVRHSPHTYLETQHWLKGARLLGLPRQVFYGHEYPSNLRTVKNARAYLIDGILGNLPEWPVPRDDRELVFEGWEALCREFATPVFFEKSPQHLAQWGALSLLLEWMRSTVFQVRIIGLIRNPLSVMYSAHSLFHTLPEVRQHGWADMHRNLLALQAMLPDDQFHLIRYEDIISDPVGRLAEVCRFIGVQEDPNIGTSVYVHSRDKWLTDLGYNLQLQPCVRQIARHFGYTDDELHNPAKPGLRQSRRFWAGLQLRARRLRSRLIDGLVKPVLIQFRRGRNE